MTKHIFKLTRGKEVLVEDELLHYHISRDKKTLQVVCKNVAKTIYHYSFEIMRVSPKFDIVVLNFWGFIIDNEIPSGNRLIGVEGWIYPEKEETNDIL